MMTKERHAEFFDHQIKAHEDEWRDYAECAMKILIKERRLFIGRIWGVMDGEGLVVLRFREGEVPRMKDRYFLGTVGADAPSDPLSWSFSYKTFRESLQPGSRYHSGLGTDIFTVNYWKTEGSMSFVLVSGFDAGMLARIRERHLDRGAHPMVVVAKTDPPTAYLQRLRDCVSGSHCDPLPGPDSGLEERDWAPTEIDNGDDVSVEILRLLDEKGTLVIQGPPGTGKSHMAAHVCEEHLRRGHSVCVTALTNSALMELAEKEALRQPLDAGKVWKTNLSNDERRRLPELKPADSIGPKQGELLLATYFKLSEIHSMIIRDSRRFDLMIIEEASQAYLATIGMFASMASSLLVIGDHRQLFPIVKREDEARGSFQDVDRVIHGLRTFAFNRNEISYRLTNTRRLTSASAALTGIYYGRSLRSVSHLEGRTAIASRFSGLFHDNGGVTIARLPLTGSLFAVRSVLGFIATVAREIMVNDAEVEMAILTPHALDESEAYVQYGRISHDFSRLTVSTVHKIQGLTTGLTIYYLSSTRSLFGLSDNIFNVATSRANRGTLIVASEDIELKTSVSAETRAFIAGCQDVTMKFVEMLSSENGRTGSTEGL